MTPVQKALWFIESRFHDDFTLADVAGASGVSQHHLIRAFGKSVGMAVMHYVKARRLTEAAKVLADGAPDIMTVALVARYQSHEAFTRAFKDYFKVSPRQIRDLRDVSDLDLMEALLFDWNDGLLSAPVIKEHQSFTVKGLSRRYSPTSKATIPSLWYELDQYLNRQDGQLKIPAFGVCSNYSETGEFDYLCGIKIARRDQNILESKTILIPSGTYASFPHIGHISGIRNSWNKIYNAWLPSSGFRLAKTPEYERYSADFDPVSGGGSVHIHIPLEII